MEVMKGIYSFITLLFLFATAVLAQEQSQIMPAKFVNNQIFVEVVTENEDTIRLLTDTGGGSIFITEKLSNQLELDIQEVEIRGRSMLMTSLPELKPEYQIPFISQDFCTKKESLFNEKADRFRNKILVMPPQPGLHEKLQEEGVLEDGLLGQDWFATRVWTFDYKEEELIMHQSYEKDDHSDKNIIDFTFRKNGDGKHIHHMPRVQAEIAGEKIDFLFDTGATTFPAKGALKQVSNNASPILGTSFITQSKFEEWREKYPDWKVIEQGERFAGAHYIEVPEVKIAGHVVGPVWFTMRPDQAFHQNMSAMMDKKVEGALGGSLFQYFKITANYPEEYAAFERVE